MIERFTDRARKVMALANLEAQRLNHEYIGTEHILLGLVKEGSGVGASVLKGLGVDLRKVRREVKELIKSAPDMVTMGKLPETPRAKKVIEYAIEEALGLEHKYVGTEHLLLGLLREHDGNAAIVLRGLGLTLESVREEVLNLLGAGSEAEEGAGDVGAVGAAWSGRDVGSGLSIYEQMQSGSVLQGDGVTIIRGTVLVLLPRTGECQGIAEEAIEPALGENGLRAVNVGEFYAPGASLAEVWAKIRSAEVIIADLSTRDPDVVFALGMCFALRRCPLLLVRDPEMLPLNLRALRYITYGCGDNAAGLAQLRKDLTRAVSEFLGATRRGAAGG